MNARISSELPRCPSGRPVAGFDGAGPFCIFISPACLNQPNTKVVSAKTRARSCVDWDALALNLASTLDYGPRMSAIRSGPDRPRWDPIILGCPGGPFDLVRSARTAADLGMMKS